MFLIYCEENVENLKKIEIKQFGLKIYPLTTEQRNYLIKEYNYLYQQRLKIKKSIVSSKQETILFDCKKRRELEQDSKLLNIIDMIRENRVKPIFHKNMDEYLNHILVLEIEPKKLEKYIDSEDFQVFAHQFINFYNIFDTQNQTKNKYKDVSIPFQMRKKYREIGKPSFEDVSEEIILKYLFDIYKQESACCLYVNNSFFKYILNVSKFISKISSDELFKFIEIMEIFFSNARLSQNNILNDTLIIESLLIKKESSTIEKEFVLKTGIIYKDCKLEKYYPNEDLSVILHYLYDMRSAIIHGNMEKIFVVYNTFTQKIKSIPCSKFENVSKMQKKVLILKFTERISYEFVKMVLMYWINHYDKISYLRNN